MGVRDLWSCASCAFLLLSGALIQNAAAMFQGDGKREFAHKVYKVKVTENYVTEDAQLLKRAKDQCPTQYSLCPSSLGGDCCPSGYACAKKSCYITADATSTCQGYTGYYACPISLGGGCCQQGLVCGTNTACHEPFGVTSSQTCPTGYYLCPSSLGGGCCEDGMGCAESVCYTTSPSTSVIVIATTTDGSATTITRTTIFTPTDATSDASGTVDTGNAKVYPSIAEKQPATEGDDDSSSSSGSKSGLSTAAIGGIIGGAVALLIVVLAVSFFILKRLKSTERAVQSRRETTSGSGTQQMTEKKSTTQVNVRRVQPTPSEVDHLDNDPFLMTSSQASPTRTNQRPSGVDSRARSASNAPSQHSGYSSSMTATRWNTPSVNSDGGEFFELPPRVNDYPSDGRAPVRPGQDPSQFSYGPAYQHHGRQYSNASELSAGSDSDVRSQHGVGSPLIPPTAVELGTEGGFVPELPGSDTETESSGTHGGSARHSSRRPKRRFTGFIFSNIVSPMSTTTPNMPPSTHANNGRRRASSGVSPLDGPGVRRATNDSLLSEGRLGSIDESAAAAASATTPGSKSMHGYFGSPTTAVGQTAARPSTRGDMGFVSLHTSGEQRPSQSGDGGKQQK